MATRFWRRTALYVGLTVGVLFSPVINCSSVTQAQTSVSVEFRDALEPHGQWTTHERWGEVWIPANVGQDWEPYKIGHWVYTEEWGWYWVSDESFGLVVYHYGRWVRDRDRWAWIPGQEWGPGWVSWRRGGSSGPTADRSGRPAQSRTSTALYVGWSPMPPDEVVVEYWERPEVWIFVRARDFTAPNVARVVLPPRERVVVIKETVVENRTVVIRERGFAVNPGIPPAFVAAAVGRPIRAVEIRPAVLAGTVQIQGAREVRPDELRRTDFRENRLVTVRETQTVIRATDRIPPPQALNPGEQGRLGDNPPRAARAAPGQPPGTPGTPATTQDQRQPGAPTTTQDQRQQPGAPTTTQDQRQQPGAPATTQDQRQPGTPTTTQDRRQRPGAPTTTQDQRQRPDRPDAAQDRRPETPATTQEQRQQRDRPDAAQDQRQQPPSGAAQERRQQPPASAQEQRPQRDRPDAAQDQRQRPPAGAAQEQRPRPEGRESADDQRQQRGRGTEGRSPPANQRPDAQPAARPDRPEGQRSEQRGEQRGQQAPGQQQKPAAGQRPSRGPQQDQGEKKDEKKDER